uniref:Uncharacterized protein n=1 Tax=Oryctolagus cuniculus TaxID=9986 RepID=G1TQM2_RABIT
MPEGPLVRKFHQLVSPFGGQRWSRQGAAARSYTHVTFNLWLQDTQAGPLFGQWQLSGVL